MSDGGGPTVPMVNEPTNWSVGGRGLGIVARLSLRWGVCVGDAHWESERPGEAGRATGGTTANGYPADGHRDCPSDQAPGETTVWAELPVRYGSPISLVSASSRDA